MRKSKLRLETLEDRFLPSDLTAMTPLEPVSPSEVEIISVVYYPHYGPSVTYQELLPAGNPYYFLGTPTLPPETFKLLPLPPVGTPPLYPPELQTV